MPGPESASVEARADLGYMLNGLSFEAHAFGGAGATANGTPDSPEATATSHVMLGIALATAGPVRPGWLRVSFTPGLGGGTSTARAAVTLPGYDTSCEMSGLSEYCSVASPDFDSDPPFDELIPITLGQNFYVSFSAEAFGFAPGGDIPGRGIGYMSDLILSAFENVDGAPAAQVGIGIYAVPEPASFFLFATGIVFLAVARIRR